MPKLLLINPSNNPEGLGGFRATVWPPLNLPYLAALTPSNYEIEVLDENIEPFRYRDADIVGITAFTSTVARAYQLSEIYRENSIPTVMGGIHVSMLPDEALNYCDSVVIGEAESIWPSVLEDFEKNRLQKKYVGSWCDLNNLPLPRRDILQNSYYKWGIIQTSRGCPMNCTFCSVTAFNGRRFRRRPLNEVLEELQQIPQKRIMLADDNIIGYGKQDMDWAYEFFSSIIDKGIRKHFFAQASLNFGENTKLVKVAAKAGLKLVFVGMESINPSSLQSFNKEVNLRRLQQNQYFELIHQIRKAGIVFLGAFVIGCDEDDVSVFDATLRFIKSAHIDVIQTTKPTPLPGTQLWNELERDGRLLCEDLPSEWEEFRFSRLMFKPAKMDIETVYKGFTYLRKAYFSFWETLKRTLYTFLTTKSLSATLIAYKYNKSYREIFLKSDHYKQYNHLDLKKVFKQ